MNRMYAAAVVALTLSAGACGNKGDHSESADGPSATDGSDGSGDGADGTGDGADGGDGTGDGSDGADGGSDGTDGGTETWSDTTDVNGVCLDGGCDLPGVGDAAWQLCLEATGGAEDTEMRWIENRDADLYQHVVFECTASSMTETACAELCAAGPFDDGYMQGDDECICTTSLGTGRLTERLVDRTCSEEGGSAEVYALGNLADGVWPVAAVRCDEGVADGGCERAVELANDGLGGWVGSFENFSSGCTLLE